MSEHMSADATKMCSHNSCAPKRPADQITFLAEEKEEKKSKVINTKPSLVSYRPLYVTAYEVYQRDVLNELLTLKPRTHKDVLENATKTKNVCFGDRRLQKIRKYLDAYPGWERSLMQKQFHEKFLQAVCIHLYKDDADVDVDKVMRINEWENLKQQVLCVTPRRFGKTTSVSMFVAAYGMTVEKSNQCIFSTGKRASDKLLEQVHEFCNMIPGMRERCKRKGEILYIQGDSPDDRRKISSYPSGSDKLRGVGGDVIYLEEAAFMSIKMFHEVILPLLELETTALICISTPQDSTNFYSMMFELKDPKGDFVFNQVRVSMVCDECKAGPNPQDCTHMKHLLPRWKSGKKQDLVRQIYGGNATDMLRESMGVTTNDQNTILDQRWIKTYKEKQNYVLRNEPRYIFVACDPNGGGASSDMAIVTLALEDNSYIVIGIESHCVKGHGEVQSLLHAHVGNIKSQFPSSMIIFIPESNLGHEASHMWSMIKDMGNTRCIMENAQPGVITTHKRKELYANCMIEAFARGGVCALGNFIVANPFADANSRVSNSKETFARQLGQFCKLVVKRGDHDLPKIIYSGKMNGPDDLVMTFMIGMYWSMQFMTNRCTPCDRTIRGE